MIHYQGNRKFTVRTIRWTIVEHCNYKCVYCSTNSPVTSPRICTNYKDIIDYLNKHGLGYTKLYGGEPTLHPNFFELVSLFKNKIGMYTNLSRSMSFFKELISTNKINDLNVSCHYNCIQNISDYIEKLEYLTKYIPLYVNVLLENTYTSDIIELYEYLFRKLTSTCRVTLSKVVGTKLYYKENITKYSSYLNKTQYIDIIKSNSSNTISEYEFTDDNIDTYNFICDMRKYFLSLDLQGNFTNFCLNGYITNVYENNPQLLKPMNIVCKYKHACLMHYLMIGNKYKGVL